MSAGLVVNTDHRSRNAALATVVAVAFVIGAVAGAVVPSLLMAPSAAGTTDPGHVVAGTSATEMSTAAYKAMYAQDAAYAQDAGSRLASGTDAMSTAAYEADYAQDAGSRLATGTDAMSTAAYEADYAQDAGSRLASGTDAMSTAAYEADYAQDASR